MKLTPKGCAMGGHSVLAIALENPVNPQPQILCPKTYENHTPFTGFDGFVFKTHANQHPATPTPLNPARPRQVKPSLQGYLAHKKQRPSRTLQQDYVQGPLETLLEFCTLQPPQPS
jgi:hypothetical protein